MKMKQNRGGQSLCLCLCLCLLALSTVAVNGAANFASKCNQVVQQVLPCLNFATGKASVPTKECCDASAKIKDTVPECLCYVIQQTHKGSPEVKSMGIQEAKIIQLPTACNLKNASITNCPKLLGLPANSPDAAIFTNASSGNATASTSGTTPTSQNDSHGSMLRPHFMADIIAVALAMILVVIPTGLVSIYS